MAKRGGALGVAVHSGTGDGEAFANAPDDVRPDIAVDGVDELLRLLSG